MKIIVGYPITLPTIAYGSDQASLEAIIRITTPIIGIYPYELFFYLFSFIPISSFYLSPFWVIYYYPSPIPLSDLYLIPRVYTYLLFRY